jgi:FMN reductase
MPALLDVTVLVGNPKAQSRTLTAALDVAVALTDHSRTTVIDLAELAPELFWNTRPRVDQALSKVRSCDLVVVATPVYKASYSGLLKSFLDWLPHRGLAGIVAVPLTVMAAPIHALAADTHLRPVLLELGAVVPTASVVLTESDLETSDAVRRWADANALLAATTASVLKDLHREEAAS